MCNTDQLIRARLMVCHNKARACHTPKWHTDCGTSDTYMHVHGSLLLLHRTITNTPRNPLICLPFYSRRTTCYVAPHFVNERMQHNNGETKATITNPSNISDLATFARISELLCYRSSVLNRIYGVFALC